MTVVEALNESIDYNLLTGEVQAGCYIQFRAAKSKIQNAGAFLVILICVFKQQPR
jgi:hypothetical protein